MAAKKKVNKTSNSAKGTKTIRRTATAALKQSRKNLKEIKKTEETVAKQAKKTKKQNVALNAELDRLKSELSKLKKNPKMKRRQLNEYNLFIRKQIKSGKTFKQAVSQWNSFKKLISKRKSSAYNDFIASQLKQGKTWKQAVALWKSLKSGRKPRARTIVKTVVKRAKPKIITKTRVVRAKPKIVTRTKRVVVKAKPKIITKYRTRTKRIVVKSKPKIKYRTRIVEKPAVLPEEQVVLPVQEKAPAVVVFGKPSEKDKIVEREKFVEKIFSERIEKKLGSEMRSGLPAGEIAFRVLSVYFEDLARTGFKRSISLEEFANAYIHLLSRVEAKIGVPVKTAVQEEEMAHKLVKLYYKELARFGVKRTMSLDDLFDAYFFVLQKVYPKTYAEIIRQK